MRSASNPPAGRHAQPVIPPGSLGTDGHLAPARVYLQPIAPPVTVGLWGFFASTMVLSTWMLHWWGTTASPMLFFTFNAAFGGLAQFLAGLWSFRARDYIASSLLTMWGGFWMAWGLMQGLAAARVVPVLAPTTPNPPLAVWFIPLAIFTLAGALAALSPKHGNVPLFVLLFTVGAGAACVCGGFWTGSTLWQDTAAWLFIVGACAAWYVGAMTMLHDAWQRVILPLGKFRARANIPGARTLYAVEYPYGQPGVRHGQ
jgi:succinate-acetate transporter protein